MFPNNLFNRLSDKRTRDRGRYEDGTNQFYEYATISIVQDGLRLCVYSMPVTLDVKADVVRELVEEAGKRGVKISLIFLAVGLLKKSY
jgi:hypothetical protein